MKAVYVTKQGVELKSADIIQPEEGEVLIKNVAVASNPKDWKMAKWNVFEGIEGNDVAGYVEAVGAGVTEFKKGDKVAAFTKMGTHNKFGAYQEYSIAPSSCTFPLAESTSFEDAATLPLAVMTAAIGLFVRLGLTPPAFPDSSKTQDPKKIVVIHGASSSVGSFAVQLAHLAKYKVIGVAGGSGQLAKDLGADVIVDYRNKSEEELAKDIKEAIKNLGLPSGVVYDAVSEEKPAKMLVEQVLQPEGGEMTTVLPVLEKDGESPSNVKVKRTMVGTAYAEDEKFAAQWYRQIAKWLDDGAFKANKVKLMPKGLASVEEGLKLLQNGKVSGEKLVYRISDTP